MRGVTNSGKRSTDSPGEYGIDHHADAPGIDILVRDQPDSDRFRECHCPTRYWTSKIATTGGDQILGARER